MKTDTLTPSAASSSSPSARAGAGAVTVAATTAIASRVGLVVVRKRDADLLELRAQERIVLEQVLQIRADLRLDAGGQVGRRTAREGEIDQASHRLFGAD